MLHKAYYIEVNEVEDVAEFHLPSRLSNLKKYLYLMQLILVSSNKPQKLQMSVHECMIY
jgi:hypothetical protein